MSGNRIASHSERLKLCRIVTVPQTFQILLREQLRCIVTHGIELTLVSSPGHEFEEVLRGIDAKGVRIPMARKPAPLADFRSLSKLIKFLHQNHFDIVHSSTPKAGFLTALAGTLARAAVRIHTFTGQPWVELGGLKRRIPRECDRIIAKLATQCYADSHSQRDFLISEGLVASSRIAVIGPGSISGVDLQRFSLGTWGGERAQQTRRELGIPVDALVIAFVGRITKDKGVVELLTAFELIAKSDSALHLILVGPFEPERDPLPVEVRSRLKDHPRVHVVGFSSMPEKFLGAADIFCLPSYREGFGSVVVEAAAMGLPSVVTRVTGLVDSVVDGVTGLIIPPKNAVGLAKALRTLVASKELRQSLGHAARERIAGSFDASLINEAVVAEYFRLAKLSRAKTSPFVSVNTSSPAEFPKDFAAAANNLPSSRHAKVRLAVQTTVPGSLPPFFRGQLAWLGLHNMQVHTVSAPGEELTWVTEFEGVETHAIPMTRTFSPCKDLVALWRLVRLYHQFGFTIVHAFTPKGGLLGMLAAALARCPVRLFTIWGLAAGPLTFRVGLMLIADKVSCALAHRVFVECPSIAELAVAKGICPRKKLRVVPAWSTSSLDNEITDLTDLTETRAATRRDWSLPQDAVVLGFVGRVVRDKGVHELVQAFESLAPEFPGLHLLMVGAREAEDPIDPEIAQRMDLQPRIHCTGFQRQMRRFFSAMDVLVHPSYREGLPSAPLEAAAMGLPVVATRIPGCIDAVQEGVSGLLVAPRDAKQLAEAIRWYLKNPELRHTHGQKGREWVLREYDRRKAWGALLDEYKQLLNERSTVIPMALNEEAQQ